MRLFFLSDQKTFNEMTDGKGTSMLLMFMYMIYTFIPCSFFSILLVEKREVKTRTSRLTWPIRTKERHNCVSDRPYIPRRCSAGA